MTLEATLAPDICPQHPEELADESVSCDSRRVAAEKEELGHNRPVYEANYAEAHHLDRLASGSKMSL